MALDNEIKDNDFYIHLQRHIWNDNVLIMGSAIRLYNSARSSHSTMATLEAAELPLFFIKSLLRFN